MAQQSPDYDEVVFGFTLKNLGSYNVTVAIKKDEVYLPIMELFNIFEVYYTIEGQNVLKGTYLSSEFPMTIDPVKRLIVVGDNRYRLTKQDIFKGDMDIYLSRDKWEEIFGVRSTVNMNRLQIMAETNKNLYVFVRMKAARERENMQSTSLVPEKYPLLLDRRRSLLGGGVLDYSLTSSLNRFTPLSNTYTLTGGGEVLGGDFQGSLIGVTGETPSFTNVRWRYVVRDNDYFSSLTAGQVLTGSNFIPSVTGISLSNEPVEPRVLFDNYVVDGYTDPESQVELYLNDRLVDFQTSNAAGYYRFQFPLTYGTMRVTIKTYSKYGDINVQQKQIQVPFTFVPKGVLTYNAQAGQGNYLYGLSKNVYFGNANLIYGATDWMSLTGGIEQSVNSGLQRPIYHAGFSSRLFSQYILDADIAPNSYYKFDANALFAYDAGIFVQYAKYLVTDTLLGTMPQQNANLSFYLPLNFISQGTGFRFSENYTDAASERLLSPRLDLNMRLANVQLLMSYSETGIGTDLRPWSLNGTGIITATAMYVVPGGDVPGFLRTFLFRGEAAYDMQTKSVMDVNFEASKTFFQNLQLNLQVDRNIPAQSTFFEVGLIMDLDFTRESSVFDESAGNLTSRHSLYGSIALDQNNGMMLLSNRDQTNKGGADVVMFTDDNNDSEYDAGDELIASNGVKVGGMGKVTVGGDSIVHVSELQNYFRYNLQVNKQQIDPNLVPLIDKFSFVVDPNQFKRIEIPFYRGGTISGTAYLDNNGKQSPLSGARIIMRAKDGKAVDTLRTFADGGFYKMDVAPNSYTLTIDSTQLRFLQAVQKGGPLDVVVHRGREADIIDTLEIVVEKVTPKVKEEIDKQTVPAIVPQKEPETKREAADTLSKVYMKKVLPDSVRGGSKTEASSDILSAAHHEETLRLLRFARPSNQSLQPPVRQSPDDSRTAKKAFSHPDRMAPHGASGLPGGRQDKGRAMLTSVDLSKTVSSLRD